MNEQIIYLVIGVVASFILALGSVTFKLVLQRMDKQESRAALDIATLRTEIATTKADANNAVNNATVAGNAAAAATAVALRESVASTALAAKENVASSASALREQVASTALASKEALSAIANSLNDKIEAHDRKIEKLEDRSFDRKTVIEKDRDRDRDRDGDRDSK
jgi:hypothetical protein